jgi:O-antigen ligase
VGSRAALAGVPLLLVPALGAVQGGFQPDAWVWSGALAAWAAALGLVATEHAGGLAAAWRWPALAGLLLAWTLASALWSAEPAQSLLEARRMLVYAAVALALVVLARGAAPRTLVAATHLGITGLLGYALLRYFLGAHIRYAFEGYFLSQPLGYANAVGILAAMGLLLALAPVGDGGSMWTRALGGASVPPLALALALSESKASWLALALGLGVVLVVAPHPWDTARAGAVPALASVLLVALGRYSRYDVSASPRIGGAWLVAATAGAAVVAAAGAGLVVARRGTRRRSRALMLAPVVVVAAGAVVAVAYRHASQPRSSYYHVAWHEYLAHPVLGSGAGTFGRYWLTSGLVGTWGGALDAHSLYVETLAELGPVGLALVAAFLLYPFRRLVASRSVPGVPAAAGAAAAFVVHSGLDWDWELPAVVVAGTACVAAVLLAGLPERSEAPSRPVRVAALACALALGISAIAGVADSAVPSASPQTNEAPLREASSNPSGRWLLLSYPWP